MLTRLGIGILWLLHFLPLSLQAAIGNGMGRLLYPLARQRRHIALTNLRLCFPQLSEDERQALARRHFQVVARSYLEHGLCWWAPRERIERLARIKGIEHLRAHAGKPVILLAPHFVGLDFAASRLALEINTVSVYSRQKNAVIDQLLYRGRTRFGDQRIVSRQEGLRMTVRMMREGWPLFYLPDMDYGARDAIFVPFFGVPAATITGLSRLCRLTGAVVVPVIAEMLDGGAGYVIHVGEAWRDFPGASVDEDTQRMNAFIEAQLRKMPEQYYWVHKRFKTRPPGEPGFY